MIPFVTSMLSTPSGGGGGGSGAHRYWRLYVTSAEAAGNVAQLNEMEMRSIAGGADLTVSGTASASSEFSASFVAANAFDDSNTTNWATTNSGGSIPAWLKYDFGAGNDVEVNEIMLRAYNVSGTSTLANAQAAPSAFKLQHSDDDSAWTDAFSVSGQVNWGILQERTFNASGNVGGTKRIWRIYVSAVNGSTVLSIREIEMRLTSGGADQTGSGKVFASSNFGSNKPINAFDNNTSNTWDSNNNGVPHWIAYDFGVGVSKDITEVTIRANASTSAPKDFDIQYSDDGGASYTTAWSVTGQTGWSAGEVRTFTKP